MQARPFSYSQLTTMLLSVLLTLQSALAWTAEEKDETWYQIEVIIAKRGANVQTLESFALRPDSIAWPQGQILRPFDPDTSDFTELENVEFIALPSEQRMLNNEVQTLHNNKSYQVLMHQSWRQILQGNKAINWIDIKAGNTWAGHYQLEGSLGFSKGRFLHVHSQLHLNQFPSVIDESDLPEQTKSLTTWRSWVPTVERRYSLIQRRKMRSKELHYLDHPKLVLLVKIIPYEPAEPILEAEIVLEATPDDTPTLVDLTVLNVSE